MYCSVNNDFEKYYKNVCHYRHILQYCAFFKIQNICCAQSRCDFKDKRKFHPMKGIHCKRFIVHFDYEFVCIINCPRRDIIFMIAI